MSANETLHTALELGSPHPQSNKCNSNRNKQLFAKRDTSKTMNSAKSSIKVQDLARLAALSQYNIHSSYTSSKQQSNDQKTLNKSGKALGAAFLWVPLFIRMSGSSKPRVDGGSRKARQAEVGAQFSQIVKSP